MDYIKEIRSMVGHKPIILCGVGCLIFNEKGEVLLQKRADDGKWSNLGGYIELGETIEETAKREVLEEAGLKINNPKLFNIYSGESQHHIYPNQDETYIINIMLQTNEYDGNVKIMDGESEELRFFKIDEIPEDVMKPFEAVKKDLQERYVK